MRIELKEISKVYQDAGKPLRVLDSVTCTLPEQGTMAVVGRSGVGKSTLLNLLGGLDRPTEGELLFDGKDLSRMTDDARTAFRGKHIGFVFQFHHLLPEFTALENVAMPLIIQGVSREECDRRAVALLERIGLSDRLEHRPGELSGGEQQRVAIARAMVAEPEVLLADEPTGNLDFETAEQVKTLLLELQQDTSCLLIIVTHSAKLAGELDTTFEMLPGGELRQTT